MMLLLKSLVRGYMDVTQAAVVEFARRSLSKTFKTSILYTSVVLKSYEY